MFLEEVVVDGFKSYSTRTVVNGFDRSFNAITGLNGSGKSNILDSICFVLGITNLSQVRAGSLQDLVYKQGQAGVTKATVSLVLNNEDRNSSPVGYEDCPQITVTRQVVIGGRNKYLINGSVAQPSRVNNLFHSVQLNVNNPHFLIMQGRITKVINMKPPELLAMVEEAAGTRMYQMKKDAALKTIEKKQRKVEEIDSLLSHDITPRLEKLRADRGVYLQWSSNKTEMERLQRFTVAYDYTAAENRLQKFSEESLEIHRQLDTLETRRSEVAVEVKQLEARAGAIAAERKADKSNETLSSLEANAKKLCQAMVERGGVHKSEQDNLATEKKQLETVSKSAAVAEQQLTSNSKTLAVIERECTAAAAEVEKATLAFEAAQQSILTGTSTASGTCSSVGSLAVDQLESAKASLSTAQGEIQRLLTKEKHLKSELGAHARELGNQRHQADAVEKEQAKAQHALQKVELALREVDFNEERYQSLLEKEGEATRVVEEFQSRYETLERRLGGLEFRYSDPEPNFDRRKVSGVVASLIQVKDQRYSKALEVSAGARLYHVVVDQDRTGKALLERGRLQRRVTILPLNKIDQRIIPGSAVQSAQRIESRSRLALSLVGFDDDVAAAIKFVFGKTVICPDLESARRVTFDPSVRCRTVTLEGDIVDPAGTITGGASHKDNDVPVLAQLAQLNQLKSDLDAKERALFKLTVELRSMKKQKGRYDSLVQKLELQQLESKLISERLAQSEVGSLMSQVTELEDEIKSTIPQALSAARDAVKLNEKKIKKLEIDMQDAVGAKQRAEQHSQQAIFRYEAKLSQSRNELEKLEARRECLVQEISVLRDQLQKYRMDETNLLETIEQLQQRVNSIEDEAREIAEEYDKAKIRVDSERASLIEKDRALRSALERKTEATKRLEAIEVEWKKVSHKCSNMGKERDAATTALETLTSQFLWIATEKMYFGQPNGDYDFEKRSPSQAQTHLRDLEKKQTALSKRVNTKAMSMFEKAEQDYQDLLKKKRITEEDRRKIQDVIMELDEKKNQALEATWKKVNRDFSSIFSTLLPGANSKLEPPEGCSALEGLEIRVAFGDVWKESLSELSGGQRSLIALSLILAMLLSKPAPMYILDEIDAALDLSHTQNIGTMLRTHFSSSQFIVVSLKEGMFNNANVIFRTKFVDGVSTVSRNVNRSAGRGLTNGAPDKENEEPTQRKRRAGIH